MTEDEKLEKLISEQEVKIDLLHKEIKNKQSQLTRACNKRDNALKKLNEKNFTDMEWLIKNPTIPGSEEAMAVMIENLYGGPIMAHIPLVMSMMVNTIRSKRTSSCL